MQPITVFESHFQAAEMLLKVYRLLRSDASPARIQVALPHLRVAVECGADEEVIVLLNDLFIGMVRERASVRARDFHDDSMALLLRQAVVSACSALDVFLPALLNARLPSVVEVRQRNFYPRDDGEVRTFFQEFALKLDRVPALLEEDDADKRWLTFARLIQDYCSKQALAHERGIHIVLRLLGIADPWQQIALRVGAKEQHLRDQIKSIVKRRNDIVHRGDYAQSSIGKGPSPIDLAWTSSHISSLHSVVLACDALARENEQTLKVETVGA